VEVTFSAQEAKKQKKNVFSKLNSLLSYVYNFIYNDMLSDSKEKYGKEMVTFCD